MAPEPQVSPQRADPGTDAVLLDAAGTLIRPRRAVGETYAAVARRFGFDLNPNQLSRAFRRVFQGMPDLAFSWDRPDELQRQELAWWRTLVEQVVAPDHQGKGDFDGLFRALYHHYGHGRAWECFPDVPATLRVLVAEGYRLAVVSNFDSRLPRLLKFLNIGERMDAVIYSSKAGSAKPHPAIFHQALATLGVAPQRALHVGDCPRADLGGAAAAGIKGLLIRRDRAPSLCRGPQIASLADLPRWLAGT